MSHKKNIAIIGAGASGLVTAILLAQKKFSVTLFEQNSKIAKKILASGNGHCNITNKYISCEDFFGTDPDFVKEALQNLSFEKFEQFAYTLGILFSSKEDGRTYPLSNEAKSVVIAFQSMAKTLGIKIILDTKIENIDLTLSQNQQNKTFTLRDQNEKRYPKFDSLVLATGSNAAPQLGGNESGYKLAQSFGHSIVETFPSLVQLHLKNSLHQQMSGVRKDAEVTLYIDRKKTISASGDVLFTSYGISGLSILDISHHASLALSYKQDVQIEINFFKEYSFQYLTNLISKLCKQLPTHSISDALSALLPLKMIPVLLKTVSLDKEKECKEFNTKDIKKIASQMQRWRLSVEKTHGFKHAEVSGGGVNTYEVNPKSMESLLVKNLFITGELLDITGRRGGYNFHFAFATAFCCADTLIKRG